jgi:large subunit ribosomal protein L10
MRHTKSWRVSQYNEIKELILKYKVIGIGNLDGFPASLLQKLKKRLEDAVFKVTSRSVLKKVLEDNGHKDVLEKIPNQAILILTNKNAFELYTAIKKSKAKSKAKIGMISPIDIVVPEGDTGLPPGPALSDLKKVGIKAQVKGATIYVPKDTTIAKAGDVITSDVVGTLSKLDIKPVELILNVPFVKEEGLIYAKDVLDVDKDVITNDIVTAVRSAINVGVEIEYPAKETIEIIITTAHLQAKALEKETEQKNN